MANTNRNHRNTRNNPYFMDQRMVAFQRCGAGAAWRWRTELTVLATLLAALVLALLAVPATRRFFTRRFWCVLVRHRIQRLCYEARLHTRAGRLPLILWTRPTRVGVRLWLACRAGICAEDFEAHIGELRAACYAREARVTRNRRWSQLVTIDIIRHDTLSPRQQVPSQLMDTPARPFPAALTSTHPAVTRQP